MNFENDNKEKSILNYEISSNKTEEILKNIFLFQNVKESTFLRCCEDIEYKIETFLPSEIMQSAKTDKKIGVIVDGKAIITSGENGVVIRRLAKNDIYGVAILFDSPVYLTRVTALTKCTVITINKKFIENAISLDKQIAYNYIQFLSERIGFLNSKISSYTAKNTESKLLAYLLQLPRENDTIILNSNYSAISKMIGIGRASLYRAFEKLENDGMIIKNGKNIVIKEV